MTKEGPQPPMPPAIINRKTALAVSIPEGTEEARKEDIRLPIWRFLQPTSNEVVSGEFKAGLLRHSLTGEAKEAIEFIPVYLKLTRVHFDKTKPKSGPLCMSMDMEHGSGCDCGCESRCGACKHAVWTYNKADHRREPPPCQVTYNFVSITSEDIERQEVSPMVLRFAKTSAKEAQNLISVTSMTKRKDPETGEILPIPLWNHLWKVNLLAKDFPTGKAYVANLQRGRVTTEEESAWARSLHQEILRSRKLEFEEAEDAQV